MQTTRLSSKGQIVLPLAIRESRAWKPGIELTVEETSYGVVLRPAKVCTPTTIDDVAGCLKYGGKPKTLAQMDEAIGKAVMERYDRSRH